VCTTGCASYLWNNGSTSRCITVSSQGNYCVTVTNSGGCTGSSSVYVHVVSHSSGGCGNGKIRSDQTGTVNGIDAVVYPNPFNVSTTLEFKNANESSVPGVVEIYSLDGRKITELFNGKVEGNTTYQVKWEAGDIADGTYMYRIICGDVVSTGRIVLMKE